MCLCVLRVRVMSDSFVYSFVWSFSLFACSFVRWSFSLFDCLLVCLSVCLVCVMCMVVCVFDLICCMIECCA